MDDVGKIGRGARIMSMDGSKKIGKRTILLLSAVLVLSMMTIIASCAAGGVEKKKDVQEKTSPAVELNTGSSDAKTVTGNDTSLKDAKGKTIKERYDIPDGFERITAREGSFEEYLRNLPLKADGTPVHYYDGRVKDTTGVYDGVIDMEIGDRDLQQCADAVMRLWAEYLYKHKRYGEIHFNFLNGFRTEYTRWMTGERIVVQGNKTFWSKTGQPSNTYTDFLRYMDVVFAYANTVSLMKELNPVKMEDMNIGDVLIDDRHSVIVVDMAENKTTGKRLFMLAQSYMPAQDIQILQNPKNHTISPWYDLDFGEELHTPEWTFTGKDLRRFNGVKAVPAANTSINLQGKKTTEDEANQGMSAVLKDRIICIDPGHQVKVDMSEELLAPGSKEMKVKNPGGAVGVFTGVPEYLLNLQVSEKLKTALEKSGAKVVMTREKNEVNLGNIERAKLANGSNADLYIRVHADSSDTASVKGVSILVPGNLYIKDKSLLDRSNKAANYMLKGITTKTGARDRGIVARNDLTGFNWAKVPMVLVEMGFMSNREEDKLLNSAGYQEKMVEGILQGIEEYFKKM